MTEQELIDSCRVMVQSVDLVSGHLSTEFCCNGKPILATDFADILKRVVKCLEACDESKSIKWAIIEANVIGDLASFTLKGYQKELFKTEKRRDKPEKQP